MSRLIKTYEKSSLAHLLLHLFISTAEANVAAIIATENVTNKGCIAHGDTDALTIVGCSRNNVPDCTFVDRHASPNDAATDAIIAADDDRSNLDGMDDRERCDQTLDSLNGLLLCYASL